MLGGWAGDRARQGQGKASQGMVRHGREGAGKDRGKAGQDWGPGRAGGRAGHGTARQGRSPHGRAGPVKAGQSTEEQSSVGQGTARQNWARHGTAGLDMARQPGSSSAGNGRVEQGKAGSSSAIQDRE
jgi:hypothetical protein